MILEAAFGYSIWQMVKANSIDEKTLKTLEKAHMTYQDALASFDQHKSDADGKLVKLINRKKAMLNNHMTKFINVYQQIQQIDFRPGEGILELDRSSFTVNDAGVIRTMITTSMHPMSDKEMAVKWLMGGLGTAILDDSKRNAAIADNQRRIANTMKTQLKTMEIAVDAIGARADQISNLLSKFGLLFGKSISATAQVIQKNGIDHRRYDHDDCQVLMTCVNFAKAIKDILDVPILSADGSVTEASLQAFEQGTSLLHEFENQVRYLR